MSEAAPAAPPLARVLAERALAPLGDPALAAAVSELVAAAGATLRAIVFFGSRRTGAARTDAWSAYDLFVVVSGYRPFYAALARAGLTGKRPWPLALVSRWLPPTQVSLRFAAAGVHVKASVIDERAFIRETSGARRDHFCIGRLFQPTQLVHADAAARQAILDGLVTAVRETWVWARPWLPPAFDAEAYGREALRISMRWEVRPEPEGRADQLWAAQRELQLPVIEALLAELVAAGEIVPAPAGSEGLGHPAPGRESLAAPKAASDRFAPAHAVGRIERARRTLYFRISIARATARWLKHVVSFEGWADYIVQKLSRHGGGELQLSERERRYPLLLLWGRAFRYVSAARRRAKGKP
jgi:hypothetical protein